MTTALNLMRKHLKQPTEAELSPADLPPVFDRTDQDLLHTLQGLPHRQRVAVLLYYVADMPVHEVARVMDVADGTVKALLSQARAKLRTMLGGLDGR